MADMQSLFHPNPDKKQIDFSKQPYLGATGLEPPQLTDDMSTILKKLEASASVVSQGKSVAAATKFSLTTTGGKNFEEIAISRMTTAEKEQYTSWSNGAAMPEFDWEKNVLVPPGEPGQRGSRSQKKIERHTAALRIIYKYEGATPENAAWFVQNCQWAVPLMTAIEKVEGAKRDARGGDVGLTENELAEIQTIKRITGIAARRIKEFPTRNRIVTRRISQATAILKEREHALRKKLKAHREKNGITDGQSKSSIVSEAS